MYNLAQVNIAKVLDPIDNPIMAYFVNTHEETPYTFTFKNKFTVQDFSNYNQLEQ